MGKLCRLIDVSGQTFERLTVLPFRTRNSNNEVVWECYCICGERVFVTSSRLLSGNTKSCGCIKKELIKTQFVTHGYSHTPEHSAWRSMKKRCYVPENSNYKYYGARGIKVCDRWVNSFENFLKDMGLRPSPKHSLDRFPNNNGNYELGNCRWATELEQKANTRNNVWIEFQGERKIVAEWARYFNLPKTSFMRLRNKYSFDQIYQMHKPVEDRADEYCKKVGLRV